MEQTWWWTWMHIWKQLWNVDFLCFDQLYTGPRMHLDQKTSLSCPPSLCAHVALSWWLGGRGLWAPSKRPCLMITLPRGRKQQDAWDSSSPALLPSQQVQGRVWVERWLSSGGSPCEAWNERKERQYAGINQRSSIDPDLLNICVRHSFAVRSSLEYNGASQQATDVWVPVGCEKMSPPTLPIVFHASHVRPLLLGHYKSEHTRPHTHCQPTFKDRWKPRGGSLLAFRQ